MALEWAVPRFPHQPQDEPELLTVDDAFLTRMSKGPLRTAQPPNRWIRGAVYTAEGELLPASQKVGGLGGNQLAQADPSRVRPKADADRLEGTWLYGGHWIGHFGHFFTETVTTLWPEDQQVDGLVFHAYSGGDVGIKPWQAELIGAHRLRRPADPGGRPAAVPGGPAGAAQPLGRGERVGTPRRDRGLGPDGRGRRRPAPRTVPTLVFFSRTAFNAALRAEGKPTRSTAERDHALDDVFAAAGYAVVTPESLPVLDQIRLAAGATVLAGCAGTALHLSAFAPGRHRCHRDRRHPLPRRTGAAAAGDRPPAGPPVGVPPGRPGARRDRDRPGRAGGYE